MTFFEMIRSEAREQTSKLLLVGTLAGMASALIIAWISNAVSVSGKGDDVVLFIQLMICVVMYVFCARHLHHQLTAIVEYALEKMKLRVIEKVDRADFHGLEKVGTSEIFDRITENLAVISDSGAMLATLMESAFILVFASLYILFISPVAFVLVLLLNFIGVQMFYSRNREAYERIGEAANERVAFFEQLTDMLRGSKEVRFSRQRSRDINKDVKVTTARLRSATIRANNLFNDNTVFAQCVLFGMLIAVSFILPKYTDVSSAKMAALVAAILFFWYPLSAVVGIAPMYTRANVALAKIDELEAKLDQITASREPETEDSNPWNRRFSSIVLDRVAFTHLAQGDDRGFTVGPISVEVKPGEVIFIIGGNGSGKSTFMKMLTGLYPSAKGKIVVDNILVTHRNIARYREMFSVIFSDFHLFSKLYGLLDTQPQVVVELLQQLKIDDKTDYVNSRFTQRDLSTGQRKRLAMVVALLEDRPIFVFDEWAADQDPEFRRYFYEELIPTLKKKNKAILAVTHDERYFHRADRILKIEYGKIVGNEQTQEQSVSSLAD